MNIFYLDENPKLCAEYHCDRHVVKMILESAQLLCTAVRVLGGTETEISMPDGKVKKVKLLSGETFSFKEKWSLGCLSYELVLSSGLYINTHENHPCSVWVRENYSNWSYVYQLMMYLEQEWRYRYRHQKSHNSIDTLVIANIPELAYIYIPRRDFTPPALAMPDSFKISSNPVECYREYYRKEKVSLHKWTGREKPFWL